MDPTEFFNSRIVYTEPQQFVNYSSGLSYIALVSVIVSPLDLCFNKPQLPEYACFSSFGGSSLPFVLSFYRPNKSWYFNLFSFFFVFRWRSNFLPPYIQNQKPKIQWNFILNVKSIGMKGKTFTNWCQRKSQIITRGTNQGISLTEHRLS